MVFLLPMLQGSVIDLFVDASQVTRGVIHVREVIPAGSGRVALYLPKWIPGQHSPGGVIQSMTQLEFRVGGRLLSWRRDPVEMFRFWVDVPPGASQIEARFTNLTTPGDTFTPTLARIDWDRLVLSPDGPSNNIRFRPTLSLPDGWKREGALYRNGGAGAPEVSMTELLDSPVLAGKNETSYDLGMLKGRPVRFHVFSDAAKPNIPEATARVLPNITREYEALFQSRHFRHYDFLTSLSDVGAFAGLEHHESSEDGLGSDQLVSDPVLSGYIFTHEFFHSWNGKYRRPKGLATADYLQPMQGELLWVYEGLTQYYGFLMAARCGLITKDMLGDVIAGYWNLLNSEPGRRWRSVADTAVSAQLTYNTPENYMRELRRPDFYFEGVIFWLEADCIIRNGTNGQRSLDDFCRIFYGGISDQPMVKPFEASEVYDTLNRVYRYHWAGFFQKRVYETSPNLSLDAIHLAGYDVVYTDEDSTFKNQQAVSSFTYARSGLVLGGDGTVTDIDIDGEPYKHGISLGEKVAAVNGAAYSPKAFREALTKATGTLTLKVGEGESARDVSFPCPGGPIIPHLKRAAQGPDLLAAIAAPRARLAPSK
jgi:predicted metalloprotease with PDZ domain